MRTLLFLALSLLLAPSVVSAQQPPLLPCSEVLCKPATCPPQQTLVRLEKVGCCTKAVCRPLPCAKARCAPAVCSRKTVKYAEVTRGCCKVALCKDPTDCYTNGKLYKDGESFTSSQYLCCTCQKGTTSCHNRHTCAGKPSIQMPR